MVPAGVGRVELKLTMTSDGSTVTSPISYFTYLYLPTITNNYNGSPNSLLTINGTNFDKVTFTQSVDTTVSFNSIQIPATIDNSNQLKISIPEGSGTVPLIVTTSAGPSLPVNFTYIPKIIGYYSGSIGSTLIINGTSFTGATVLFGSKSVTPIDINPTNLTVVVPDGVGNVALKVTTPGGPDDPGGPQRLISLAAIFTYLYVPMITGTYSGLSGRSLVINGTNLNGSIVSFGLTPVVPTNVNPTNLTVVIPQGSGTVPLILTSPGGVSLPVNFTYIDTPVITGSYSALAGTILKIKGTNFTSGSTVSFGMNSVNL